MQGQSNPELLKILTDSTLWGKDYPAILSSLKGWQEIEEHTIVIFPKVFVGMKTYQDRYESEQKVLQFESAITRRAKPKKEFKTLIRKAKPGFQQINLVPFTIPADSTIQLQYAGTSLQFLATDLTMELVQKRLGKPESITHEITESDRGHRPLKLTKHHYADGAVIFIETNWDPLPGMINRVQLNVTTISSSVFK